MDYHTNIRLHDLISLPKKRLELFRMIPVNKQGTVLLELPHDVEKSILNELQIKEIVSLNHYLDPDETTDILQKIDDHSKRRKILNNLKTHIKESVETLLKFEPQTAAGMMSINYIEVGKNANFKKVELLIRKHEKRTGRIPTILAVENGYLLGEIHMHDLALHTVNEKIKPYIKKAITIRYDAEEDEIIKKISKPHNKIVVLDDDNSILGVIYSDDILPLIKRTQGRAIYKFTGVSKDEEVYDSISSKVKNRYKWLILNLFISFAGALVVSLFQETIQALVLLAVYMPIIAGMGGNTGAQAMAVMIRGIALKQVESKTARKAILNEFIAAGLNGIIIGAIASIIAVVWNKSPLLGLVIAAALIINLMIAGFFGALLPLIMKNLGKDPATSATIFITATTDIFGFFIFLGLASLLL